MQRLLLQTLMLRQVGRFHVGRCGSPKNWTQPWMGDTRQLWGFSIRLGLDTQLLPNQQASPMNCPLPHVRYKSSKKKGSAKAVEEEEEEEEEEDSDYEEEHEEEPPLLKDYKDIEKNVQSLRYDLIMKVGLDMARNKVEDAFYDNKLRLNGQKLIKKSKTVKVGDTLDLVLNEDSTNRTVSLMRVKLKKVAGESKDGERLKVMLRRWKNIQLPKQDVFK